MICNACQCAFDNFPALGWSADAVFLRPVAADHEKEGKGWLFKCVGTLSIGRHPAKQLT